MEGRVAIDGDVEAVAGESRNGLVRIVEDERWDLEKGGVNVEGVRLCGIVWRGGILCSGEVLTEDKGDAESGDTASATAWHGSSMADVGVAWIAS